LRCNIYNKFQVKPGEDQDTSRGTTAPRKKV